MIDLPSYGPTIKIRLGSFLRMRPLLLNYTGTEKLKDFQVKCTLTSSDIPFEKLRADKCDLLFVDDNNEIIPYWIEKRDNSEIVVWLKISEISGARSLTLYYGNYNFTGMSNGEAVFDFFDDFEGDALDYSKWNDSGFAYIGMKGCYKVENSLLKIWGDGAWRILQAKVEFTNKIWEVKFLKTSENDHHYALTDAQATNSQRICMRDLWVNKRFDAQWQIDAKPFIYSFDIKEYETNTYYNLKLIITKEGIGHVKINGASATKSASSWANTTFTPVFWTHDPIEDWIDWVFLRKYADPEPFIVV